MSVKIKICGVTKKEDIQAVCKFQADYVGFVFYADSSRYVNYKTAQKLSEFITYSLKKVALFVNPEIQDIQLVMQTLRPDYLQLHGAETTEFITEIKMQYPNVSIIKALGISGKEDLEKIVLYESLVDIFILDAPPQEKGLPGGNGVTFDWSFLKEVPAIDWMLSGGLNANNVGDAIHITKTKAVDVSSGVETKRGHKTPEKIMQFIEAVKEAS